jgi:hypothetical protein
MVAWWVLVLCIFAGLVVGFLLGAGVTLFRAALK